MRRRIQSSSQIISDLRPSISGKAIPAGTGVTRLAE
jgi:hypothetical protein